MACSVPDGDQVGLTKRQAEFLAYVRDYVAECGVAPAYSEIAAGLGLSSKGSVDRLAQALSSRGHLRIRKGMKRSLVVTSVSPPPVVDAPKKASASPYSDRTRSVRIPVKLDKALQALARRAKIPASSIIVDAIEDYIMEQPE